MKIYFNRKRLDAINYARKLVDGDLTENDVEMDENIQVRYIGFCVIILQNVCLTQAFT